MSSSEETKGILIPPEEENKQRVNVIIYTEVSLERAREILQGVYELSVPTRHFPNRWYAEIVLDHFEPPQLREKGVSRQQAIFASPIPYQGSKPIHGRELLVLEVNPEGLYVAEADHVSEIITPTVSSGTLERIILLKNLKLSEGAITRQEFEDKFNALSEQQRARLIALSEEQAKKYWESVITYREYATEAEQYYEPEILMIPETQIFSAKKFLKK